MASSPRRLATVHGIDIRFHSSWFIILVLIAFSLGTGLGAAHPAWSAWVAWSAALLTTALFFVSVVLHELAHSLVAQAHGLRVRTITLFVFGGVSELPAEPANPSAEFRIAIAGPLASVALGGLAWGLSRLGPDTEPVFAVLNWLGTINLLLAGFNLLPGFPLDGGRVLRALLWNASRDYAGATRWATRAGRLTAFVFILGGVLEFFTGRGLGGLWLAFIGWFLLNAAEQSWRQVEFQGALRGFLVRDLETPFFARVPPDATVGDYMRNSAESHHYRASLVLDGEDRLLGVILPGDLARLPRAGWESARVADVMIPRERVVTVDPAETLAAALEKMARANVGQLPVIENDRVRGVVRRDRILELLQRELAAARAKP